MLWASVSFSFIYFLSSRLRIRIIKTAKFISRSSMNKRIDFLRFYLRKSEIFISFECDLSFRKLSSAKHFRGNEICDLCLQYTIISFAKIYC